MATMKVVQVPRPGGDLELVQREVPEPGAGQVRIRVQACGVCHSDVVTKDGLLPGIAYPRVPGHEVIGLIDAIGPGVTTWKKAERVGVGWHGGHDFTCPACRRGDFINCVNELVCGVHYDGGYAEFMIAPSEALARVPDGLEPADAAPLMCAGVTTFNALRHSGARPGDLVAVQGIGGLGHLGVQFARKLGYRVAAIGRGTKNAALAQELGAHVYIDSAGSDAVAELKKLGGAVAILSTAPSGKAMTALLGGLAAGGTFMAIGAAPDPIEVTPNQLVLGRIRVEGWASGIATDSEDTLNVAKLTGVRPMIEKFPLAKAADAYASMLTGKVRYRAVLTM
jgi:D-arabinose 1-dehydrogenase-like Zn-dependent alcohol dehydrogenase